MQPMRYPQVAQAGTATTLTLLPPALRFSHAEALTVVETKQACSHSTSALAIRSAAAGSVCALPSSTLCNFEPCHLLSVQISNWYYGKIRVSNIKLVKEFGCLWHPNFVGIKLYYSNFVTAGNPVFKRGGNYNNGDQAGVFTFNNNNGNPNNNNGFRVCLAF